MRNPITAVRQSRGKTLKDFASDIGINRQALYLNECGVYPNVLPRIRRYIVEDLQERTNLSLRIEYQKFVLLKLEGQRGTLDLDRFGVGDLGAPDRSPLAGLRDALELSRMGFCKTLCLHPARELGCENGKYFSFGEQIERHLLYVGISEMVMEEMIERQRDFYRGENT